MDMAVLGYPTLFKPGVTKCIIIWGSNLFETNHRIFKLCMAAKSKGALLIVVDPRKTGTATEADVYLRIRPGTDGALALSTLNVVIEEELYDNRFLETWCSGLKELKEYTKRFSPEEVENITWIPAAKIKDAPRMYAENRQGHITWGSAIAKAGGGIDGDAVKSAAQWKAILRAICGNLEVERGHWFRDPDEKIDIIQNMRYDQLIMHAMRKRDSVGAEIHRSCSINAHQVFGKAMENVYPKGFSSAYFLTSTSSASTWRSVIEERPYPIKAIITQGSDPLVSTGNAKNAYQAMKHQNLALNVAMDFFMTPTCMLADYVLPAAGWVESSFLTGQFAGLRFCVAGEQCVSSIGERKNDYFF